MARYGMAIDLDHCTGCQTCVVSCQLNNALHPNVSRNSVDALEWGRWPEGDLMFFAHSCIHCDEPLCAKVCPTGASRKRDDGIVDIDQELCIGCGVCITACEYGARSLDKRGGFHFGAAEPAPYEAAGMYPTGVVDKCTFCRERVGQGGEPACVQDCVAGVRAFGDLDDPESGVSAFIKEHNCTCVPGTSLFYGCGERDLDLKYLIVSRYFASAKNDRVGQKSTAPSFNPAVVGAAGVATIAVAAGLAATAKHSRFKRQQDTRCGKSSEPYDEQGV